ncbi:type II toxin-antitoxin system VapC family toxin [Halapricum desulfuricans]|uniref:Ribonuclease VapC n=1 Tax=Halapricum desulfuricans TaxID=2841257 RepID=A0A897N8M6_9EURY|nr:PIN domain-containing protein [Halapricum desulfuricans]QSG09152.1 PIN domain containing protein [Halapricum desulfuricans]
MILDACFLIDLLEGDDAAVAKLDEISDDLLVVPTLVYTEVAVGIDPETAAGKRFEEIMDGIPLAPYDGEATRHAVDVQRDLQSRGERIGAVDAMIAGIALARGEPIVTRNAGEFARTPVRVSPY